MPFIQRRDIDLPAKKEADVKYRRQLRSALSSPELSEDQRRDIRRRLDQVKTGKVYDAESPPPPGAITLDSESSAGR